MTPMHRKISVNLSPFYDIDVSSIAEKVATYEKDEQIIWHTQFATPLPHPKDGVRMAPFSMAMRIFNEEILLPHLARTRAVSLYEGDLTSCIQEHPTADEELASLRLLYPAFPGTEALYLASLVSETLHLLAADLSEETPLIAFFDGMDSSFTQSPALAATLLSKELFPYIDPHVMHLPLPLGPMHTKAMQAKLGMVIPPCAYCTSDSLTLSNRVLHELHITDTPHRVLSEVGMNEHWNGLDTLLILSDFLSEQGIRQAQGFASASGQILIQGPPMNIPGAKPWKDASKYRPPLTHSS